MQRFGVNQRSYKAIGVLALSAFALVAGATLADANSGTLTSPNGIAFSELKDYDRWQPVVVATTGAGIEAILGNPAMIEAYRKGIPENGKPFPDGAAILKIEAAKVQNRVHGRAIRTWAALRSVSLIEKDSSRFPDTSGWGYAQFLYDPATGAFKPYGSDKSFGKTVCYQCHRNAAARDFIFTNYPRR